MPFKARTRSKLLKMLKILNTRFKLTAEEKRYYLNLEKGYQGEVEFDQMTDKLTSNSLILNDLQLTSSNTSFQLDTSMIYEDNITLCEVKNLEGDYQYEAGSDIFKTINGKDILNPLDQLKRSKTLLSQLLHYLGFNITIEAYVIFINPAFTLYQAPKELPFIYPTQLKRFLNKLDTKQSQLSNVHMQLAEKLASLHGTAFFPSKIPSYQYNQIKKGFTCKVCDSFSLSLQGKFLLCNHCGCVGTVESAVLRVVDEIKLLFPELKITTNIVHDWCQIILCKRRISRILGKHLQAKGTGLGTFYE